MQMRKGEKLPTGWAQGPDGKETQDAHLVNNCIKFLSCFRCIPHAAG